MTFDLSSYESLGEAFLKRFPQFRRKTALIEADRDQERTRYTYQDVEQEARRITSLLQECGFSPGDRCAILMSNQSKWLLSGIGVFWAGGVLVPLDYKLTVREQANLLHHCEPRALVVEWILWEKILKGGATLPEALTVFVTEAPLDVDLGSARRWESSTLKPFQFQRRSRNDVCAILYSSGTGGRTKGCELTHGSYLSQVENFQVHIQMREKDLYFSILPTHHGVDFVFGFLLPLLRGAGVVHQRMFRIPYLFSTLKKYRINVTTFVPVILKEIQSKIRKQLESLPDWKKRMLRARVALNRRFTRKPRQWFSRLLFKKIHAECGGRLRLVMTGGSFVDPQLARFFYDFGFFVGIGYGLTEAGTAVSAPLWNHYFEDNVGKVLPNMDVQIRNPDSHGVGEIWVRGPSLMLGYFRDVELTQEVLVDGWLRTDDLGQLDSRGYLKIRGRRKNMIVTEGGKNIYPEDIETAFADLPDLKEHCVFATHYVWPQHALKEERLFIVLRPSEGLGESDLVRELKLRNRRLAEHKRVAGFLIWDQDFPRTTSLKIKRQLLAEEIRLCLGRDAVRTF